MNDLLPERRGNMLPDRKNYSLDVAGNPDVKKTFKTGVSTPVALDKNAKAFNHERVARLSERKEPIGSFCKKRPDGTKKPGKGGKSFSPWCK